MSEALFATALLLITDSPSLSVLAEIKIPIPTGLLLFIGLVVVSGGVWLLVQLIVFLVNWQAGSSGNAAAANELVTMVELALQGLVVSLRRGEAPASPPKEPSREAAAQAIAQVALQAALAHEGDKTKIADALKQSGMPRGAAKRVSESAAEAAERLSSYLREMRQQELERTINRSVALLANKNEPEAVGKKLLDEDIEESLVAGAVIAAVLAVAAAKAVSAGNVSESSAIESLVESGLSTDMATRVLKTALLCLAEQASRGTEDGESHAS